MSLSVLIVDDEPLARQRLQHLLAREPDVRVVGNCGDGLQAVAAIEALNPDLVLLDVRMPELDGFGVVEAVGVDRMPTTLFITAFGEHAHAAFEAQALDYVLKPVQPERFARALDRARTWVRARRTQGLRQPELEPLLATARAHADRFLVKAGERYVLVRTAAIQWIEAEDNYVRLHVEGHSYLLRMTMTAMAQRLDPRRFRRIHRSYIANLDAVQELQPWSSGDHLVLMKDGTRLSLSRTYRDGFAEGF